MPSRSDIRDWVRQQTLLEADDWGDDKVNAAINQGLRRLSTRFDWPWLAASTTLTLVAGTSSYPLPTDLRKSLAITHQAKARRIVEVSPHQILGVQGGNLRSGYPTAFYVHGRTMYLDSVPTEAETYDWLYYRGPTMLDNDTDEPEFSSEFHLILADYAIARGWEREEDFVKAEAADEAFKDGIEEMAAHYLDVSRDKPVVWGMPRATNGGNRHMPWLDGA